jgi:hypothetical protein
VLKRSKRTWSPTMELRRGPKEGEPGGGGCLRSMTNRLSSALEPVCHSRMPRTPGSATLQELFEAPPLSCGSGIDVPVMLTWLNQFSLGVFSVNLHFLLVARSVFKSSLHFCLPSPHRKPLEMRVHLATKHVAQDFLRQRATDD